MSIGSLGAYGVWPQKRHSHSQCLERYHLQASEENVSDGREVRDKNGNTYSAYCGS
jgi:hypothetical protein